MLDFEAAKQVARDRFLSSLDHRPGGQRVICDDECVEFEWGWLIAWKPSRPDEIPEEDRGYCFPLLVDRVTGNFELVGSPGQNIAIIMLLERRPPEHASPDIVAEPMGPLTRLTVSTRAFTPLSKLQANSSAKYDSLELFRQTARRQQ